MSFPELRPRGEHSAETASCETNKTCILLYTSRVLKLEIFGTLISVSISSPDKLGKRWLNLTSQSSPGLAGVSSEGPWP